MGLNTVTFEQVEKEAPNLTWLDISNEEWRAYMFINPDHPDVKQVVRIASPVALSLSKHPPRFGGGGHRIVTSGGLCYYIPQGWISLTWEAKCGSVAYEF